MLFIKTFCYNNYMLSEFYNKKLKKPLATLATILTLSTSFYANNQASAQELTEKEKIAMSYACAPDSEKEVYLRAYLPGTEETLYFIRAPLDFAAKRLKVNLNNLYKSLDKKCQELQAKLHKDDDYCPPNSLACVHRRTGFIPADEVFYTPYKGVKW